MYSHPDSLIKDFIKTCDSQIQKIVNEMHMTEFFVRDRMELLKLVKVLEKSTLYILSLAKYKISNNNDAEKAALLEYDQLKSTVHELFVNNSIDEKLIDILHETNIKLKNGGKNNV